MTHFFRNNGEYELKYNSANNFQKINRSNPAKSSANFSCAKKNRNYRSSRYIFTNKQVECRIFYLDIVNQNDNEENSHTFVFDDGAFRSHSSGHKPDACVFYHLQSDSLFTHLNSMDFFFTRRWRYRFISASVLWRTTKRHTTQRQ